MAEDQILDNGLPQLNRYITDHRPDGKAVFNTEIPAPLSWQKLPSGSAIALSYSTTEFPANLDGGKDIAKYQSYLQSPPGLTVPGGSVLRVVDLNPGSLSPMHRTLSLDYGVVMEGEIDLLLDSGEVRHMKRGDIIIQRGTMHAWRNPSKTDWARVFFVMQESQPVQLEDGKTLGEDDGMGTA
ncbi:hypothetical protein EYB25_007763 [Talaromyces marneffei]|uniref:Cupin type-2 domain-containing protein n=1 Tax=Talaromyces marneffei (strain ATCC 18224 / CBS 334.59 / QM 7333) TaxID=441960 RepID=B6QQ91_TALMQ|nr:uncharacterized protein EYB26_005315 [Talaromyces marneffei]EEA20234.1 conserved hypothetical protein [Talaromyces marneffei ATCC 18224]KAE8549243.1 hypothetical protein EYB25_007763 [Talaromyces marneffei]QGA17640.1 hypothetical protein EYB26_005315 [Talaromyces marneffei]